MNFSNLTDNQQFFACALTDELQLKSAIKKQASADICYPIQRVAVEILLELRIAEGNKYRLKRGKNWHEFHEKHGNRVVILQLLASEFQDINFPEKATNVLPFPCPN